MTNPGDDALLQFHDGHCACDRDGWSALRGGNPAHIVLSTRGAFGVRAGSRTCLAPPGTALVMAGEVEYQVRHPRDDGHDYLVVAMRDDLFEELVQDSPAIAQRDYGLDVHVRLLNALRLRREHKEDRLLLDEIFLELVRVLGRARDEDIGPAGNSSRCVRIAVAEIAARFDENVSLNALAGLAQCSPYSLSRHFRAVTGFTMAQYRTRLRLLHALERVFDGEEALTGLALDLGFSHHSHFTASFGQWFGQTPSTVRSLGHQDRELVWDVARAGLRTVD
jgi:AraC family transcriptional regulator